MSPHELYTATPRAQRDGWVDAGRALSVILVALHHSFSWWATTLDIGRESLPGNELNLALKDLRLPFLFFIAGLFAAKWATASWKHLVRGKLWFLVWPLAIWSVIVWLSAITADQVFALDETLGWSRRLLRLGTSFLVPINELWFLWGLILCFLALRLLHKWPRWLVVSSSIALSVLATIAKMNNLLPLPGAWLDMACYYAFFVIAASFSASIRGLVRDRRAQLALIGYAVLWVAAKWMSLLPTYSEFQAVGQFLAIPAGIGIALLLSPLSFLRTIGKNTLPIYVSHTTFIIIMCIFAYAVGPEVFPSVMPILLTAVSVGLGWWLASLLGKSVLFVPPRRLTASAGDTATAAR